MTFHNMDIIPYIYDIYVTGWYNQTNPFCLTTFRLADNRVKQCNQRCCFCANIVGYFWIILKQKCSLTMQPISSIMLVIITCFWVITTIMSVCGQYHQGMTCWHWFHTCRIWRTAGVDLLPKLVVLKRIAGCLVLYHAPASGRRAAELIHIGLL